MRFHPSMVAQAFATIACLAPGRVFLGVGTGESMNEVPALGIEWPGFSERLERLAEAIELIRALWTRGPRHLRRASYYRTRERHHLRPARPAAADPDRGRRRRGRPASSGPRRRRLHHHQRQAARALHRDAAAGRSSEGAARGRAATPPPRAAARGEGLLRPRPRRGPSTSAGSGRRWRCPAEASRACDDPLELERLADAPARPRREPLHRHRRPRGARPTGSATTSTWASATSSSTAPRPTRSGSWRTFAAEALPRLRERFG